MNSLPDLGCVCATARRTARLVTQMYAREMGSSVEPAQFTLLAALERNPGAQQGHLGAALGLDKTTMSRNLRVMERNGWIERTPRYRLTKAGAQVLTKARPGWSRAQEKMKTALGTEDWHNALNLLNRVAEASSRATPTHPPS
jgi:DNA-binding MarR family transcriptional regulator